MRERLGLLFEKYGAAVEVILCKKGERAPSLAQDAIKRGCNLIVAAGGDGSVNAVASAVAGSEAVLGVLPLGTLNHFAKDLGIPTELEAAVENLISGRIVRVDVGEVNGHVFLNNSSLGLYPAVVQEREKIRRKGYQKWTAFAHAIFYVLRRYSHLHVVMRSNGQQELVEDTPFVFVGNNEYNVCGANIGTRTCLTGGRLWVYRAPKAGRGDLLRLALRALLGTSNSEDLPKFDADEFRISVARGHVHVATDGEVKRLTSPLIYRIRPEALKVIVPFEVSRSNG